MNQHIEAMKYAFKPTIPILTGFLFLGMTFGIYMHTLDHPWWIAVMMSALIFAGSMEFIAGVMLLGSFNPLSALLMTLMLNARHLFYGIAMLDKFKDTGRKKFYLIFGMCDESFVINQTIESPKSLDKGLVMFYVTLFNHIYWISGSLIGSLLSGLISFKLEGLEFVMAALFIVIFLEQCLKGGSIFAFLGMFISIGCIFVFSTNYFIIPTMILLLLILIIFQRPLKKLGEQT